jgi:hypothetical protein
MQALRFREAYPNHILIDSPKIRNSQMPSFRPCGTGLPGGSCRRPPQALVGRLGRRLRYGSALIFASASTSLPRLAYIGADVGELPVANISAERRAFADEAPQPGAWAGPVADHPLRARSRCARRGAPVGATRPGRAQLHNATGLAIMQPPGPACPRAAPQTADYLLYFHSLRRPRWRRPRGMPIAL